MKRTIGFIGLGLMGSAMALRLLKSGYTVKVFNRTAERGRALLKEGAEWAPTSAQASVGGLVFTMLSTSEVLKEIALAPDGILSGLPPGGIHIDCSTVSPLVTEELANEYARHGKTFLHCPVLGSIPQVVAGELLLMVGGDLGVISKVEEVLYVFGKELWKFETVAQASHAKLICNSFIAGMIVTLSQALVFSQKTSVDPRVLLDIVGHSALNSPMYQSKGKNMLEGNFVPRFFARHMLKDIDLVLEAAKTKGISLPGTEVARDLFRKTMEQGLGDNDYSAVIKALESNFPNP